MAPIEYEPSRSNTGVQVVPSLTVFQTPPEAEATKKCEGLFGSTAKPMTRPEVNAGPIERNLKPLKVGVDIGSRGFPSSSAAACSGLFDSSCFTGTGDGTGDGCCLAVSSGAGFSASALADFLSRCPKTESGAKAITAFKDRARIVMSDFSEFPWNIRIISLYFR